MRFAFETEPCRPCGGTGRYRDRARCGRCGGKGRHLTSHGERAFQRVRAWLKGGRRAPAVFGHGVTVRP